jgi:hypothetical protein
MARLLSPADVAVRAGLAEVTVTTYHRKELMRPADRVVNGEPRWQAGTVRAWLAERGPRRAPAAPVAECGTPSGWRAGCRCVPACRQAHNDDTRAWRREKMRIPDSVRRSILADLAAGGHITEVADAHELTQQRLHRQGDVDPQWKKQMDQALMTGRHPDAPHSTEQGYRRPWRCRCPECRRAHHPEFGQ